jgi:hypothetical protein
MIGAPPNQPGHFDSALLPLPAAGANINVVATHGRGSVPRHVEWVLVCLQAELEYTPGDEIQVISGPNSTFNPTVWKSAAQTGVVFNGGIALQHYLKLTINPGASITNAKWALKCYCTW